ncbi:MAG: AzlC family protein [Hyphomicrobiales bacterium]|nr:MAG: AzlC family protein [Hyphomicrobiales bacterium]
MTNAQEARSEFLSGAGRILPLAAGAGVYGLAFGLLAAQAGMDGLQVGIMGSAVFAGASQIVAVERFAAGAGALIAIIAGLVLNLRLLLITASIRDIFAGRPFWQIALGAHAATDENWALMMARRASGQKAGYWFLVGSGASLMAVWLIATISGALIAAALPEPRALGMDFAFTAAFIAIARSLWTGRRDLLPWTVSFAVVALSLWSGVFDKSWALILGGVSGAALAGFRRDE